MSPREREVTGPAVRRTVVDDQVARQFEDVAQAPKQLSVDPRVHEFAESRDWKNVLTFMTHPSLTQGVPEPVPVAVMPPGPDFSGALAVTYRDGKMVEYETAGRRPYSRGYHYLYAHLPKKRGPLTFTTGIPGIQDEMDVRGLKGLDPQILESSMIHHLQHVVDRVEPGKLYYQNVDPGNIRVPAESLEKLGQKITAKAGPSDLA